MATIALYAGKVNQMPGLIRDVKASVAEYKAALFALKIKTLTVNRSVCDMDDVISSIQSSTQMQERKESSLDAISLESEAFVFNAVCIDLGVADTVRQRKEDFYRQYAYLKPECEKNGWEKFKDGLKKTGEWCREHWKLIVAVVVVIAAVVVCVLFPAAIPFVVEIAKGALLGAAVGGLTGGGISALLGESFWEGFKEGALWGAVFGGLGGAGRAFAGCCKLINALGGAEKVFQVITKIAKISGTLTSVMGGYDMLALVVRLFHPSNPLVSFNEKLHANPLYNIFQFMVSATAAFSSSAYLRMRQGAPTCIVAGTMILTAEGLAAIENIRAGSRVIATNPETFEAEEKTVVETYERETRQLVHLTVGRELISTTADHPFYVKGKGFVNAVELQTGDELVNVAGAASPVENICLEIVEKPEKVYNFQVEEFHTYHVGNSGVLVHNANAAYAEAGNSTEPKEGMVAESGSKTISYTDYDNIYQSSIHNAGKEKVMLGKYDGGGPTSYITKAGDDYTYFSLGNEWNTIKAKYGYTDDDMFKLFNEAFLDDGINAGKTFQFSHNPINDTGALGQEYQYLLKNNYKWDAGTMTMKPRY